MQVIEKQTGPHVAWSLDGSILTIGGEVIDLAEAARDVEQVITLRRDAAGVITPTGSRYAAIITIPPHAYAPGEVTETMDGEEVTYTAMVVQPFDPASVRLELFAREG